MVVESLFIKLSVIIILAVGVSIIMKWMRQPLIIGYVLSGVLVSAFFSGFLGSIEGMETFSKMGVAILLFMVGLSLNPRVIKEVGKVSLVTGAGQLIFTFAFGVLISRAFGFTLLESSYIAIALAFSSTIIIMKLLSDKGDTSTLYGKISIGFLIVQDLVAILVLMAISSFSGAGEFSSIVLQKIGIGSALLVGVLLTSFFVVKPVTKMIARSQELLLLFSIGWALSLSSLFEYFGFSIEIGALLAGITLSVSPYRYEIGSRMKPIRDFFLLIFFILLGSQLSFENFGGSVVPVAVFSLFVLIGNPLIVMFLMGRMGYTKRSGFLSGLTVSQISEFSFILIALGVSVGHLSSGILSLVTIVGLITMATSSYAILHGNSLYLKFSKHLSVFERKSRKIDDGKYHQDKEYDIILFGYNRIGYSLVKSFKKMRKDFLVVDNNPDVVSKLAHSGVDCRYGDAEDVELLESLPLKKTSVVISTIPILETNVFLLELLKKINKDVIFIPVSHQIDDALNLYELGATYVLTPHLVGGEYVSNLLEHHKFDKKDYEKEGYRHTTRLLLRKKEGHRDLLHERD